MAEGALTQRVGRCLKLSDRERAALASLESQPRSFRRGAVIRRERDGAALWILRSGWVAAMLGLPDGGRQITRIHLTGDLLGMTGTLPEAGAEAMTALTDVEAAAVPRAALAALFVDHPRLAALLFQFVQIERLSLGDRIAAIGRTDARARVAGLLLDLLNRSRAADPSVSDTLPMPLTQEHIGDAIGLTAVHVNRMMRLLAEGGLIERSGGNIRVRDEATLVRLSSYVNRWLKIDTDWLPPGR